MRVRVPSEPAAFVGNALPKVWNATEFEKSRLVQCTSYASRRCQLPTLKATSSTVISM